MPGATKNFPQRVNGSRSQSFGTFAYFACFAVLTSKYMLKISLMIKPVASSWLQALVGLPFIVAFVVYSNPGGNCAIQTLLTWEHFQQFAIGLHTGKMMQKQNWTQQRCFLSVGVSEGVAQDRF